MKKCLTLPLILDIPMFHKRSGTAEGNCVLKVRHLMPGEVSIVYSEGRI